MRLRTETRYNNSVSILRGPVYYSLRVGMEPKSKINNRSESERCTVCL